MASGSVREPLQLHYDGYYGSPRLARWRRLGAIDKADRILALCRAHPHDSILEIGCGDGAVLERLDELDFGTTLSGLEISKSGIEAARQKRIGGLREVRPFDGYEVPYGDGEFDLAILTHVVEHVEHPRRLLYEAGRVARFVFVEVPLEHTLRLRRDYVEDPVGHINFYTDKTIRRLMQTSGFEVLEQVVADGSRALLTFQHGWKGALRHALRRSALTVLPGVAKRVFVYNSALLCRSPGRGRA